MNEALDRVSIKLGDVFLFRYHDMKGQSYTDSYWCFEGKLVAKQYGDRLVLHDTYWTSGNDGRTFSPEEAAEQGALEFVCNLNDVEDIKDYELRYYDDKDVFNLSFQHGCYKRYAKRKGAKRSKEAMRRYLYAEMKEAKEAVDSAVRKVEWIAKNMQILEDATDLDKVWL